MTSYSVNLLKTVVSLYELTAQRMAQSDLVSISVHKAIFCLIVASKIVQYDTSHILGKRQGINGLLCQTVIYM